jgi:hypothetical protein
MGSRAERSHVFSSFEDFTQYPPSRVHLSPYSPLNLCAAKHDCRGILSGRSTFKLDVFEESIREKGQEKRQKLKEAITCPSFLLILFFSQLPFSLPGLQEQKTFYNHIMR